MPLNTQLQPYPSFISYGKQTLTQEDIQAVIETLQSPYLTQGPKVQAFEQAICDYTQSKHALSFTNGTAALHTACLALGLGPGDALWTSPISFVASANCGVYCGAQVDFVDIDPVTRNLCPDHLEEKLKQAKAQNRLPKILVVVHFAGLPAELIRIKQLSDTYGFYIIEDGCHALGGRYQSHPVGSCTYSDVTTFSFHPVKPITTGEGGMLCTNNPELYKKAKRIACHGITRDPNDLKAHSDQPWYYEMHTLGFNFRLTDFQAALGTSQLKSLDRMTEKRNALAQQYQTALSNGPFQLPAMPINSKDLCAFHIYVIELTDHANITRLDLFNYFKKLNIGVNVHYIPIHLQPFYRAMGFKPGDFPNSEAYYERCLTLPLFPTLSRDMQDFIIQAVVKSAKHVI